MAIGSRDVDAETLAPDEAFSALGNGVRMDILRVLGGADDPLSFSDLRRAANVDDPGRFYYHLDQLVGHFISQQDDGYALARPGIRMIEAVLSGAVTEAPVLERTAVEWDCPFCGSSPIEVEYREEQLGVYCTSCEGMYGGNAGDDDEALPADRQRLHYAHLPPAGLAGRDPDELLNTATTWTVAEGVMAAMGICPSCSAQLEASADVCEDHGGTDGICEFCNRRYAILYETRCTNCVFDLAVVLGVTLLADPRLRHFLISHGLDPLQPRGTRFTRVINRYEEEVLARDPLEVAITFRLDDDAIRFTIDDDLTVVEVSSSEGAA